MNLIIRILVTALLVVLLANILPGVDVADYTSAILVAIVLGLLNIFVKPILVILTLPITVVTFGLFLLVINALIIQFAGSIVSGFSVTSFWYAMLFSVVLSIAQSIVYGLTGGDKV
jgi:putative membrane protein